MEKLNTIEKTQTQTNAIDALRQSIEQECRFKTVFHGYDKKSVQEYLKKLAAENEAALIKASDQCRAYSDDCVKMAARLAEAEKNASLARADERRKIEAENSMTEGLIANLRTANQRLTDDNREKQLQIAELNHRLEEARRSFSDCRRSLDMLSDRLEELLKAKLSECSEIIASWKNEFGGVTEAEEEQLSRS